MRLAVHKNSSVREITSRDVLSIRHSILQFAESAEASILSGDEDARALHFGFFVDTKLVGVASLFVENISDRPGIGHRLRAMAVVSPMQRKGIGAALVKAAIDAAYIAKSDYLWCTVRKNAIGFYRKLGLQEDEMEIVMAHGTFTRMILTFELSKEMLWEAIRT